MNHSPPIIKVIASLVFCCSFISCDNRIQQRSYKETILEPKSQEQDLLAIHANVPQFLLKDKKVSVEEEIENLFQPQSKVSWTVPDGWSEYPGSGMRMATLKSKDEFPVECSLVSLEGRAGGLESNVIRWMQQIQLSIPSEEVLNEFLASQESIQLNQGPAAKIIDLTPFSVEANQEQASMIAALIINEQSTLFVKMTGSVTNLTQQKNKLKQTRKTHCFQQGQ